jgi:hypothetical protein
VTAEAVLADTRFETLRQLAMEAAVELGEALGTGTPPPATAPGGDPVLAFRSRLLAVQAELSAAALLTQSTRDVREVMLLLIQLVLPPAHVSGPGALVNALSGSLGRRRRRKLRRILGEDAEPGHYADVDFDVWRTELRALAAAEVLRRDGAPLRTALLALLAAPDGFSDLGEEVAIGPQIEAEPAARALLGRLVGDWVARL